MTIPDSVTSIGSDAFLNTAIYDNDANWTNDVLYIGNQLIKARTSIKGDYIIPNGTVTIADNAFYECSGLASVVIPNTVTSIGQYAFSESLGLTSVALPDHITSIGNDTFYNCSSLASVTIPDAVTSIGGWAFCGCSGLSSVTIPASVTLIDYSAFSGCTGLTSLTVQNEDPANISIGMSAFYGIPMKTCVLYVPKGCIGLYASADYWKDFQKIMEISNVITLRDGEDYTDVKGKDNADIAYIREFGNTDWQPLYVPFNMSYEEWSPNADVAELYNVRSQDNDGDDVIDVVLLEFNKLTEGEIVPNVPYVIRAKESGTVTFNCEGKELSAVPAEEGYVDCCSTKEVFTLYGVCRSKSFAAIAGSSASSFTYQLAGSTFIPTTEETVIPAGRFYLAITPRSGAYPISPAPSHVKLSIIGEEDQTGVQLIESDCTDNAYYDMTGRRVAEPASGIYIHKGKKIILK